MASLISVRLNKGDAPSLGFRLQGGKDFGTPLVIQKVNGGSPAERAGLTAGDSVIKINNTDVFNLRHKDAQDVIIRAGPSFEVTVQRGGSTWKPSVIPTGSLQAASPISPVTKTSLAAQKQENIGAIGTGHNVSAKPFGGQSNGVNGSPKLVNNQYNSPLKLYSEESIAETLSAQTEVLSTGALGVNFKKNEKNYDATNSAVFRMLQEAENDVKSPEPDQLDATVVPSAITGLRHVSAPENKPTPPTQQLPPGQNICADCERLIVGVFVRIKDKNLHVECFKCCTCGCSLKNVGYYNINGKLYCDVHAKLAARTNPPAPNLVPVTVPPGGKAPVSAISAALASHSLPSPGPLSPRTNLAQPFQQQQHRQQDTNDVNNLSAPLQKLNVKPEPIKPNNFLNNNNNLLSNSITPVSFSKFMSKAGNYTAAPKPFASVSAPNYNTHQAPKPLAPLSPVAPPQSTFAPAPPPSSFSPASSLGRVSAVKPAGPAFKGRSVNIVWPPPPEEPDTIPTACPLYFVPTSHLKVVPKPKKDEEICCDDTSDYSELDDINNNNNKNPSSNNNNLIMAQQPKMSLCSEEVCNINVSGRKSAVECIETISESLNTQQLVECVLKNRPKSPPPIPQGLPLDTMEGGGVIPQELRKTSLPKTFARTDGGNLQRLSDFQPNTIECQLRSQVENAVPQQWESAMTQAIRTVPPDPEIFNQIPKKFSTTSLASALSIAPSEPFASQHGSHMELVPLPEETVPYFPPEQSFLASEETRETKIQETRTMEDSQFVRALQTAPERLFTPTNQPKLVVPRKVVDPTDEFMKDLPKNTGTKLSMRDALTTASDRPYTPLQLENATENTPPKKSSTVNKENLQRPIKPATLPSSFQLNEKPQYPKPYPIKFEEKRMEQQFSSSEVEESKVVEQHRNVQEVSTGGAGGRQSGATVAPKRGRGVLNTAALGGRIPLCGSCHNQIRGPFITALGKIWCPEHFMCSTPSCRRPLQDLGFVEEQGQLYCEYCFEQYLAPPCAKCNVKIKGDCLKAIGKNFHPECFNCSYCGKLFGNSPFFLEDGAPYCEADWNEMFTTKCFACGFPVEAGDRWVEALNNNYHSQCFNCTMCKKNLEGQSFFAKGGRPFCKNHAR